MIEDMEDHGPLPARLRRDRTVSLLRDRAFLRVTDLAETFNVSEVTVRGDLDHLATRGLLRRVRGGAVPPSTGTAERPFEETATTARAQKRAIARVAVDMIEPGESVILDAGTTTHQMAELLAVRGDLTDITVFTSSIPIALALETATSRVTVIVTGGTLRPKQHSLVEPLAGMVLEHIRAATAFIGCNGVDVLGGITNVNLPETAVKQRMLASARQRVVVADSSKLDVVALAKVCDLDDVDLLITDAEADPAIVDSLRDQGLSVELAQTEEGSDA